MGILIGAVFGMAVIAFLGAWRSVLTWRRSTSRPAVMVVWIQAGFQVVIGLACIIVGIWLLLGE